MSPEGSTTPDRIKSSPTMPGLITIEFLTSASQSSLSADYLPAHAVGSRCVSAPAISQQALESPPDDQLCPLRRSSNFHARHVRNQSTALPNGSSGTDANLTRIKVFIGRITNSRSDLRRRKAKVDPEHQNGTHRCNGFREDTINWQDSGRFRGTSTASRL